MALRALQGPAGGAAPVGGSGTTNYIPRWAPGPSTLGDSGLIDNGTAIYTTTRNVGIGVIPSAWASSVRAEEMRTHARWNYNSGSDSVAYWTVNAFLNSAGNAIYKATAAASQYTQIGGAHVWERAVSGTAGNTVTWLESARIDSAGNVGIGTASPISPLHVKGNATNTDGILTLTPNTGGRNHQVQSLQASSLFRIFDQSAGASRLEIDINGNISAATTGGTFNASTTNAGIKLPATPGNGERQTLDAYAELDKGVASYDWTPTLTGFGGTTPTVQAAKVTRVGRQVTVQVWLSATGGAQYSGTRTTTFASLPVGMTPAASSPGSMTDSGIQTLGTGAAYTNGNLYWPTFALTTADTFLTVTYTV